MHTLEIAGKPVAIINADMRGAEDCFNGKVFRSDLTFFEHDGRPLWLGRDATALVVRTALPDEIAAFERAFAKALVEGAADREERLGYLAFLVPIGYPTDGRTDIID